MLYAVIAVTEICELDTVESFFDIWLELDDIN